MSNHETPSAPPQEEDIASIGTVVRLLGLAVMIFAVAICWAWLILRSNANGPIDMARPAPLAGQPEIGIVDQRLFEGDERLEQLRQGDRDTLDGYGWVDGGTSIHIPIDRAMAIVAGAKSK